MSKASAKSDRIKACELASVVMSGRSDIEGLCPLLWSVTVFFENYINEGSAGTLKDFGPKKPAKLKVAKP